MKSLRRTTSVLFKWLLLALALGLASAASATNIWYVDGMNGSDNNDCKSPQTACQTIGHAISLASSGDSITVAAATYTEKLTIGFNLKILGADATSTIIDGGGKGRVVKISGRHSHVTLSKLTISKGHSGGGNGGGISNNGTLTISDSTISGNYAANGGGVYNAGTLTINNSTISGNSCKQGGGGINNAGKILTINNSTLSGNGAIRGGGIYGGPSTINKSTFSGNSASYGGGIYGGSTINNSTFNGNSAGLYGGGIYTLSSTINNSTFSGNSAGWGGGGIENDHGTATLQNSIIANSTSGGNCHGTMTSNGYNLSDDNTCNFGGPGDFNNSNPELGTLGNYGGPTQTIPLLVGSPAINAGNPNGCTDGKGHLLKTDQRGKPRPDKQSGICDMGAFERQTD